MNMIQALVMMVPPEAYLTLMVLAGLLMIVGFRKAAGAIVSSTLIFAVFGPFFESLAASLPAWVLAILLLVMTLSMIRMIMGRGVYNNLMAMVLFNLIRLPFRFLAWMIRGFAPRRKS